MMKNVVFSAVAAAMMGGTAYADTLTLYTDPNTGHVFTTPGEGRVEMGDFIGAKEVDVMIRDAESKTAEYQEKQSKYVNVKSKAKTLEFSGVHYFGLTSARPDNKVNTTVPSGDLSKDMANSTGFEMRRNYVQVKGYFNDKDYFRVTMDATKELNVPTNNQRSPVPERDTSPQVNGFANVFIKYAYIWLDNILPYNTGAEIGIIHRPWIDYEEHNSWYYRSWSKVALENRTGSATNSLSEHGPDLVNSADLGVNFKTKTENFTSEIGVFNGEGYHADKSAGNQDNSESLSVEWRLTGHLIGSGEKVGKNNRTKETYAHVSTYGLVSYDHKDDDPEIGDKNEYNRFFYGIHAVYNQPEFLIAGQYYIAKDDYRNAAAKGSDSTDYKGWSVNAEYRPFEDWTVIARYDAFTKKDKKTSGTTDLKNDGDTFMAGVAYNYNKYVTMIASGKVIDDNAPNVNAQSVNKDVYMLTTEVKW